VASTNPAALCRVHEHVEVFKWSVFGSCPGEQALVARATQLQQLLCDAFPEHRFIVIHRYRPEVSRTWGFSKQFWLGSLEVRATLRTPAGRWVCAYPSKENEELGTPPALDGETGAMTLLLTQSFDEKLERLAEVARGTALEATKPGEGEEKGLAAMLVDALLVDLAMEQRAVLSSSWRAGLSRDEMRRALPRLRRRRRRRWMTPRSW